MSDQPALARRTFESLSVLHLGSVHSSEDGTSAPLQRELRWIDHLSDSSFQDLLAFADLQRIRLRTLQLLAAAPQSAEGRHRCAIETSLQDEHDKINRALEYLEATVTALEHAGVSVVVIKSLDHWPDVGSDLDLFAVADACEVCRILAGTMGAALEPRSWGDRLAGKWNFRIPGLPQLVEVHLNCLGQTGEQTALSQHMESRSIFQDFGKFRFRVPAPEEQLLIATLQRMYRHFYIRLTDIVNLTMLVRGSRLDFAQLRRGADLGALWPGVCTLLQIVSDCNAGFGIGALDLPVEITGAARFRADLTRVQGGFLRLPVVPQAASLYLRQLAGAVVGHNFRTMFRLSLLPPLAAAAFVNFRMTGNDKGIW